MCTVLTLCTRAPIEPVSSDVRICTSDSASSTVPNAARFGIFDTMLYRRYPGELDTIQSILGSRPGYILWYLQIDDPFPMSVVRTNQERGMGTVISMNVRTLSGTTARNDTLLREVNNGLWDSTFREFARGAKQSGTTVYLRFGYEMNGNWFPWGEKPQEFVAAYKRAHSIFQSESALNVRWIFSPGALWAGKSFEQDLLPYYPGDSIVDIIGIDGYNFGENYDVYHQSWQSFSDVFNYTLLAVESMGKPVWITEIGCPSDPRRPAWLREMFGFMDRNPCVEALLWFNVHNESLRIPDFRLESDSGSLAIIRDWIGQK